MIRCVYFLCDVNQLVSCNAGYFVKTFPCKIVLKQSLIFERHAKGLFGSYVETNEDYVVPNKNHGRKLSGISLDPTRNIQGTQNVFDIRTDVIKNVEQFETYPCAKQ